MTQTQENIKTAQETVASLADEIEKLCEAAHELSNSGLTDETIVLLLHDHSKVGKRDIKAVLHSLKNLGYYLKPRNVVDLDDYERGEE